MALMNRSTLHDTFVVERTLPFEREFVFEAWTTAAAKSHWFAGPSGWQQLQREMEFRPGGYERVVGRKPTGRVSKFDARYYDIVPNERIVYAYEMYIDDVRISISIATIEFNERDGATQVVITEQGVFLDDFKETRGREEGTEKLLEQLEAALHRTSTPR